MASFYFLSYSAEAGIRQRFSRGYISGTLRSVSSASLLCPSVIRPLMFSFNTRGVFTLAVVSSQTNPETSTSPDWRLPPSLDSFVWVILLYQPSVTTHVGKVNPDERQKFTQLPWYSCMFMQHRKEHAQRLGLEALRFLLTFLHYD